MSNYWLWGVVLFVSALIVLALVGQWAGLPDTWHTKRTEDNKP